VKTLGLVPPTPEQLTVIDDPNPGFWLIRGAAGSGKTTTALLRLRFLVRLWRDRHTDLGITEPVRVLVLTFNRTLRGYISELARSQIPEGPDLELDVSTFGAWAYGLLGRSILERQPQDRQVLRLAGTAFPGWTPSFLTSEVDYVLGRFLPEDLESYMGAERRGRGVSPKVDQELRRRLLDQVIHPYVAWKRERQVIDWHDVAVELARRPLGPPYDIVVVDEAQDFSANQVRAILQHLGEQHVTTFIRDEAQRIYPTTLVWSEVGIAIPQRQNKRLRTNYRNTRQIAAFARPLVEGMEISEDGDLPNLEGSVRDGPVPVVLRGLYSHQVDWAINYLRSGQIGSGETVAFLHPLGGGWFSHLTDRLAKEEIPWATLTRESEWPKGAEQIALSTMHSAKGLEFDHVLILGYNAEVVQHGDESGDTLLEQHRRLLAMAIGRARQSVVVGYNPDDASQLIDFLDPTTYTAVDV
jgi:superfamily I DNA/RNA helicase